MSGFHTATICADCDPPVVALSTGYGCRCPRCGRVEERSSSAFGLDDGPLARRVIIETAVRSDGDARLLAELARRLLDYAGKIDTLLERAQNAETALRAPEVHWECQQKTDALAAGLREAIDIFEATWCPEHGHAPKPEQHARAAELRKLVGEP